MSDPYAEFAELLRLRDGWNETGAALRRCEHTPESDLDGRCYRHAASQGYYDALQAAYRAINPKRKMKTIADLVPLFPEITAEWQPRLQCLQTLLAEAQRENEQALYATSETLEIPVLPDLPREEWAELDQSCSSHYLSQSSGAGKYAKNALRTATAAHLGIPHEVREKRNEWTGSSGERFHTTYYYLYGATTALGAKIFHYKPDAPLREVVKFLLQNGANPRVLMPFLPYGYEESVGLDAFGDDVPTPKPLAIGWKSENWGEA